MIRIKPYICAKVKIVGIDWDTKSLAKKFIISDPSSIDKIIDDANKSNIFIYSAEIPADIDKINNVGELIIYILNHHDMHHITKIYNPEWVLKELDRLGISPNYIPIDKSQIGHTYYTNSIFINTEFRKLFTKTINKLVNEKIISSIEFTEYIFNIDSLDLEIPKYLSIGEFILLRSATSYLSTNELKLLANEIDKSNMTINNYAILIYLNDNIVIHVLDTILKKCDKNNMLLKCTYYLAILLGKKNLITVLKKNNIELPIFPYYENPICVIIKSQFKYIFSNLYNPNIDDSTNSTLVSNRLKWKEKCNNYIRKNMYLLTPDDLIVIAGFDTNDMDIFNPIHSFLGLMFIKNIRNITSIIKNNNIGDISYAFLYFVLSDKKNIALALFKNNHKLVNVPIELLKSTMKNIYYTKKNITNKIMFAKYFFDHQICVE